MAELTTTERLQPSLLDRLTDDEPTKRRESRDRRVLSVQKLRESVIRDLSWLLNTGNLSSSEDFGSYPFVGQSVLNYGMPDLTGLTASTVDITEIERLVRQAVWDFEPRILRDTVVVRAVVDPEESSHNALCFEIEGEMWAQPLPMRLYLKTEIDLETGSTGVVELSGPGSV